MLVFGRSKEMIKAYTQAESECLASELLPIILKGCEFGYQGKLVSSFIGMD
ncbi:hypothetical protein ACOWOT_05020 [Helicobacter pylori]